MKRFELHSAGARDGLLWDDKTPYTDWSVSGARFLTPGEAKFEARFVAVREAQK